jgi:microcystin synthetase protein McyG
MADLDSEVPVIFVGLPEIQRRTLNLMMIGEQIRGIVVRRFGVPPVAVLSIPLEVIPRTSIGKVQRSRLGARFAHGEFDDDWLARPSHRSADKTSHGTEAVESRISAICQEIMGMPEISTEVELIDLGVTSLLMVMLRQALEREFTRVPTVAELYRLGTIASIAAEVA